MASHQLTYYYQNRERILKQRSEYYCENKEMIKKRSSTYFQQYYEENKERLLQNIIKYRIEHREEYNIYKRQWCNDIRGKKNKKHYLEL